MYLCGRGAWWAAVYGVTESDTTEATQQQQQPGFFGGSDGKESACSAGDQVQSLAWQDPLKKKMVTHASILDWRIPMDRRAWWATVRGITKSWAWLSSSHFPVLSHFTVLSWFLLCSWSESAICVHGPPLFWISFHLGHHRALSRVPCSIKQVLISNLFYKYSARFSRSVVSDSLRSHGLEHARPPCPSPTPGVYSNSCASSRWCHPTITSSVVPFSSGPQSFP